eukprot:CAMPEP_0185747226 /NCGR_PEP_ID=MMETSP1174-20130828/5838_1 /TAXON_ID=35687 /ORGANISM="Dictyocha speculum, Strain CCMP1381" /LENGTH=744 /DNA_ID=CAMNT_0028422293 /DNA_START=18 /DNA_END=2249 /DNA_ORIENTATION=+
MVGPTRDQSSNLTPGATSSSTLQQDQRYTDEQMKLLHIRERDLHCCMNGWPYIARGRRYKLACSQCNQKYHKCCLILLRLIDSGSKNGTFLCTRCQSAAELDKHFSGTSNASSLRLNTSKSPGSRIPSLKLDHDIAPLLQHAFGSVPLRHQLISLDTDLHQYRTIVAVVAEPATITTVNARAGKVVCDVIDHLTSDTEDCHIMAVAVYKTLHLPIDFFTSEKIFDMMQFRSGTDEPSATLHIMLLSITGNYSLSFLDHGRKRQSLSSPGEYANVQVFRQKKEPRPQNTGFFRLTSTSVSSSITNTTEDFSTKNPCATVLMLSSRTTPIAPPGNTDITAEPIPMHASPPFSSEAGQGSHSTTPAPPPTAGGKQNDSSTDSAAEGQGGDMQLEMRHNVPLSKNSFSSLGADPGHQNGTKPSTFAILFEHTWYNADVVAKLETCYRFYFPEDGSSTSIKLDDLHLVRYHHSTLQAADGYDEPDIEDLIQSVSQEQLDIALIESGNYACCWRRGRSTICQLPSSTRSVTCAKCSNPIPAFEICCAKTHSGSDVYTCTTCDQRPLDFIHKTVDRSNPFGKGYQFTVSIDPQPRNTGTNLTITQDISEEPHRGTILRCLEVGVTNNIVSSYSISYANKNTGTHVRVEVPCLTRPVPGFAALSFDLSLLEVLDEGPTIRLFDKCKDHAFNGKSTVTFNHKATRQLINHFLDLGHTNKSIASYLLAQAKEHDEKVTHMEICSGNIISKRDGW